MNFRKYLSALLALALLIAAVPAFDVAALAASKMPYRINVDLTNQIVTIYDNKTGEIVRQCLCSSGAKNATPEGTFTMPEKKRSGERKPWFHFNAFGGYARYASRVYMDVMFHSLLYSQPNVNSLKKKSVEEYGYATSHGCIRLRWQDAKFIAENCLPGTRVKIYKSKKRDNDLRSLLYQSSFALEDGRTYKEFLGIPNEEGAFGRYSEGDEVRNLQLRLRDLGLFTDKVDGFYGVSTITAVREAQKKMNMEPTGAASLAFQAAIYSNDAPFSMNTQLKEGVSGPAVRSLQESLGTLLIYEGPVDGVYDVEVMDAVKVFQSAYGYTVDGVATPMVQRAAYYEAGRIQALFSTAESCRLEKSEEQVYMGRVTCELGIKLRSEPSVDSRALGSLKNGNVVIALERENSWSKVQKGSQTGYVMNKYLDFYAQTISSLRYSDESGNITYVIGYTAEDYFSGADRPADIFEEYLSNGGSLDAYEDVAEYATVKTESDATLNLREAANTASAVLDVLENGTQLKILVRNDDWAMVSYNGVNGYVLAQYLEVWTGPEDLLEEEAETEEEMRELAEEEAEDDELIEHAEVNCDTADRAEVYEEDSEDAKLLGSLPNGTRVEVDRTEDGWSHILLDGREGYMREMDLRFIVEGTEA